MRVGLIVAGPLAPNRHSGTPWALARAFAAIGHEVVPIEVELRAVMNRIGRTMIGLRLMRELERPIPLDDARTLAFATADYRRLESRRLSQISRARGLGADVLVQYGTAFLPPAGAPLITYEDMTSVQAARYPHWPTARLPRTAIERLQAYQRAVYARAARCATTTEWPAASIVGDFGVDADKVKVVGIGRNYQPRARTERDFTLARFLFVGGDWERKNGPALLEAFARVREHVPHAELALVGPVTAPEPPGVKLYGHLDFGRERDRRLMESLYDRATCFVLPSLCEPSGISYLEAMSAGLPVIVSSEGGSRHVAGDAGIVVDPHDIAGLAETMLRLTDPDAATPLARAALERASGRDWTEVTRQMLANL